MFSITVDTFMCVEGIGIETLLNITEQKINSDLYPIYLEENSDIWARTLVSCCRDIAQHQSNYDRLRSIDRGKYCCG